ncbi:hypothetical protein Dimus_028984, partial [Dionaea muscipula]
MENLASIAGADTTEDWATSGVVDGCLSSSLAWAAAVRRSLKTRVQVWEKAECAIHVGCARVAGTSSGTPPTHWSPMLCAVDTAGCLGLGCRVLLLAATAHSGGRLLDPPWKSAA